VPDVTAVIAIIYKLGYKRKYIRELSFKSPHVLMQILRVNMQVYFSLPSVSSYKIRH
jgi:hypothetical protein